MIAYAFVAMMLRPLTAYLRDGSNRIRARRAALGMQETLPGARDLFVRAKGTIILVSALYLQSVYLVHRGHGATDDCR